MKFLPVLAMLLISVSANARSIIVQQNEVLPNVVINGEQTSYVGILNMNFIENTIKVDIYNDMCRQFTAGPDEATCRAAAVKITSLEVPMQKRENSCGSKIYSGIVDQTPVDGMRTDIRVTDNTRRLCEDVIAGLIVVNASKFNPWTQTTSTYYLTK